jgi:peptidyl-prolyl cis-trans isomerase A (cyclophilin A)
MRPACSTQLLTVSAILLAAIAISGCGKSAAEKVTGAPTQGEQGSATAAPQTASTTAPRPAAPSTKPIDPMVIFHTSQGDVTLKLYLDKAPRTVENFLRNYAERGFYNETIFHHVEPGQMIIAGGYTADFAA